MIFETETADFSNKKIQNWKYCNILACLLFQCFETGGNATEED